MHREQSIVKKYIDAPDYSLCQMGSHVPNGLACTKVEHYHSTVQSKIVPISHIYMKLLIIV